MSQNVARPVFQSGYFHLVTWNVQVQLGLLVGPAEPSFELSRLQTNRGLFPLLK